MQASVLNLRSRAELDNDLAVVSGKEKIEMWVAVSLFNVDWTPVLERAAATTVQPHHTRPCVA